MRKKKLTQEQRIKRLEKVSSSNYFKMAGLEKNLAGLIKELKEINKIADEEE